MYARALQADGLDSLLNLCYSRIQDMRLDLTKIQIKDSAIIANYDKQLNVLEEEKKVLLQAIADKNRDIRRQRRNAFWSKVVGTVTTGIVTYLLITK